MPTPTRRATRARLRAVVGDDTHGAGRDSSAFGRGRDRGMSTVEAVLTVPVMVAMVLGIVQAALWWYAHQVAETAADQAARSAAAYSSTGPAGASRGTDYISAVDPHEDTLRDHQIHITRTATTVTVRVTGQVVSLVPFLSPDVHVTLTAPVERYVPSR
jgi:Flp pilus assembly protein TadG